MYCPDLKTPTGRNWIQLLEGQGAVLLLQLINNVTVHYDQMPSLSSLYELYIEICNLLLTIGYIKHIYTEENKLHKVCMLTDNWQILKSDNKMFQSSIIVHYHQNEFLQ